MTTKTQLGHKIEGWRTLAEKDWDGENKVEAYVVGFGWCRYCYRLSAILIDGKWVIY